MWCVQLLEAPQLVSYLRDNRGGQHKQTAVLFDLRRYLGGVS